MTLLRLLRLPTLVRLYIDLTLFGVSYGKNLRGNRVILTNNGRITLGDRVRLNSYPDGEPYRTALHAHCKDSVISIGNDCILNGTIIHCRTLVTIGTHCMFGPGSKLVDNDSHRLSIDIAERNQPPNSAPIHIENNVWVGMNSLILKGVSIGQNSIVAACSVVTRPVPENVLVAGNPAKIIKHLIP